MQLCLLFRARARTDRRRCPTRAVSPRGSSRKSKKELKEEEKKLKEEEKKRREDEKEQEKEQERRKKVRAAVQIEQQMHAYVCCVS